MMIDLKAIHEMWAKDCVIDSNELDKSSREQPLLHAKYLELLSTYKLQSKRAEFQQKVLLKQKWLYYNGKMDHETLQELGWEADPFNGLKILKGPYGPYIRKGQKNYPIPKSKDPKTLKKKDCEDLIKNYKPKKYTKKYSKNK